MGNKIIYLISLLFILISCTTPTGNIVKDIPQENFDEIDIFFCSETNCNKLIADKISTSNKSVNCAFYNLKNNEIINSIKRKNNEIPIKLVFEEDNYKDQITGNNIRLTKRKSWGIMHNKFCIFDDNIILTGSYNPSQKSSNYDNNLIVIKSKYLASNFNDEFQELWNNEVGTGSKVKHPIIKLNNILVENYFCPEDNCDEKIINLISKAEKSIYFMAFSFTSEQIADQILFKENIEIKGVVEKQQSTNQYAQFNRLKDFGIDIKTDNNKYLMHHKVFIIDSKIVITGSANPTESGYIRNDENIIILHDKEIASQFIKEFNRIYK